MNTQMKPRLGRRWAAMGAAAALLSPVLGLSAGTSALAVVEPVTPQALATAQVAATSGTLEWGVRTSIRTYLEQYGHTAGWVLADNGASYAKGDSAASFPLKSGTVDPTAGTASLSFGGSLEMVGFGESWLYFDDIRLDVAGNTAVLTVDLLESYNVKTPTNDIVLSTFEVPSGGLTVTNDKLRFTTEPGRFSAPIATQHLPSYGGPTYAAPNDHTDPLTLQVNLGDADPGIDPGPTSPAAGPYGASSGTVYSNSQASIRVAPGYAINADGATTITVQGSGFDPGTADRPANIYVGLGTMLDQSKPEVWRKSLGGTSGPVGKADYTYGMARLAVSHFSSDSDVADAVIDASGNWELALEVPGKTVPSFFGDEIDCVVNQCGIFAFGAHGVVKAANEAYTPIYFDGQDSSSWPDRDGDDGETPPVVTPPVVVPPVVVPPVVTPPPGEKECKPNGTSTGKNSAGATLEVTPSKCLGDKNQTVSLSGTSYPTSRDGATFGGVYVLFGWVDESNPDWAPTKGGASGKTFTYANDGKPSGTFQQMVNFPGNTTGEGMPTMNAKGEWKMEFPIEVSQFASAQEQQVDCYKVTCGIITIGAHGLPLDGGEVFTPVYFTADEKDTGNETPKRDTEELVANPNVQLPAGNTQLPPVAGAPAAAPAAAAAGPLATTGDEALRGAVLWGVLLLSASAFMFASLRARRMSRTAQ